MVRCELYSVTLIVVHLTITLTVFLYFGGYNANLKQHFGDVFMVNTGTASLVSSW